VDRTDTDREEVKQVHVNLVDKNLTVQRYLWRTPIRRRSANRSPTPEPRNPGTRLIKCLDLQTPIRHRPAVLLQRQMTAVGDTES